MDLSVDVLTVARERLIKDEDHPNFRRRMLELVKEHEDLQAEYLKCVEELLKLKAADGEMSSSKDSQLADGLADMPHAEPEEVEPQHSLFKNRQSSRTIALDRVTSPATPQEFDDHCEDMLGLGSFRVNTMASSGPQDDEAAISRYVDQEGQKSRSRYGYVLMPASRQRLSWDFIIFVSLLFELWSTPFELIFCTTDALPGSLGIVAHVITGIFAVDIVLNFNTGYLDKERVVTSRRAIARNYLGFWVWTDLLSTVPWDQIASSVGGGMLRWVRIGKAAKILKTLRYLKLLRSIRMIQSAQHTTAIQQAFSWLLWAGAPLQLLLGLCIHAHCHGCIWAAFQPHWLPADSFGLALQSYFQSFYWAFSAITIGNLKFPQDYNYSVPTNQSLAIWIIELLVAYERICLMVLMIMWALFQTLTRLEDTIRLSKIKKDAMDYLKRHQVSFASQVQVLYILHETGRVRQRQRHFRDLMEHDLPVEMKRKISVELWAVRLRSLGLIERLRWEDDHFLVELALVVREEVFASRAIVFRIGDASYAAYCVMDGILKAINDESDPEYTVGQWIGETALVNPRLRRTFTMLAKGMTSLMAVPAAGFHELLDRYNLRHHFQSICEQHLWKGLCGRCGQLGDHYSDSCPTMSHLEHHHTFKGRGGRLTMSLGAHSFVRQRRPATPKAGPHGDLHGDLQHFLHAHDLMRITRSLSNLKIRSLSDLQRNGLLEELREDLRRFSDSLSQSEERALAPDAIAEFHLRAANAVKRSLLGVAQRHAHYIFISHSKLQAGTEATLMQKELENLLSQDPEIDLEVPVFLDSENLWNLKDIQNRVKESHNLVVLLTSQVLTRPWVLVEIVTASKQDISVVPVNVIKPGDEFEFPKEPFYRSVLQGKFLSEEGMQILAGAGISPADVEKALRDLFREIAVSYSPHRNGDIRKAELKSLLRRCSVKTSASSIQQSQHAAQTATAAESGVLTRLDSL